MCLLDFYGGVVYGLVWFFKKVFNFLLHITTSRIKHTHF